MNETRIVLENKGTYTNPADITEYEAAGGYQALEAALAIDPFEIVEIIKESRLRGRGGAGFPTGLKWAHTLPLQGDKYILCNADEGEPGTFKDRIIMEEDPHKLLEGILIAGYAVGAHKAYLYIRGEYTQSLSILQDAVYNAYQHDYLGSRICGTDFSFDITIQRGAGSYICGEKTALVSSLEGKRGNPWIKPPSPRTQGLWKNPSIVQNVETLAIIPSIISRGAAWFTSLGTEESTGTKLYPVSGKIQCPGCYEFPMSVTLRELIYDAAGGMTAPHSFKAALVGGGAAGTFLGPQDLDVQMNFEGLSRIGGHLGSGAVIVMDETISIREVLEAIMEFFIHESCGYCIPCRIGTVHILNMLRELSSLSQGEVPSNYKKILSVAETMKKTCLCPLGQYPLLPLSTASRVGNHVY
ncbi:MAG: SLBB domain-containing protein [Theionarchaea archaeon]|nr:SLBB domain-containing protein [Theionarchaea archaeon]